MRKAFFLKNYGMIRFDDVALYLIKDILDDESYNFTDEEKAFLKNRYAKAIDEQSTISCT